MYRPKWLSAPAWAEFKTRHLMASGYIKCVTCDATSETALMSVDHIVPRHQGGKDDVANLQPMCVPCNSRKNCFPDTYWSKQFYFDRTIRMDKLRVSQYDFIMGPVSDNADFFAHPWSSINSKLFSYVQIVGAGKTIGMFALPFALNRAVNGAHQAAPRADRMLIVTKDMPLRSQIASELQIEPVAYGIIDVEPKVLEVTSSDDLTAVGTDHDIAVMCPNMLWPEIDKQDPNLQTVWSPLINDVLARYRLIVFDEMHYATKNIARLVAAASQTLVFGFTASPLDENGDLINDIVLMGQPYGHPGRGLDPAE